MNFSRAFSNPRSLVAAGAVVAALVVGACSEPASSGQENIDAAPPPLVAAETIEHGTWQETLRLTAELHPWAAVTVAAEIAGRVVELPVEHGDTVRRGQLLARLETTAAEAELERARARLESTRVALAQADRDLERGRALARADQGIVSEDDVDRWTLARDTRAAESSEAQAALRVVEEQLADMEVRAPFDGVVSERHVETGSWVSSGSPVARILDLDPLKIRASVSSVDRMNLRLDQAAEFATDAASGASYPARLRFLGREADPATGTFLVEAEIDRRDGELLPGLQGALQVVLAVHEGLSIPKTAILKSASGEHVFVIENGTVSRREIETAEIDARRVEVLSGLAAGDRLVVQGHHRLVDGQAVEEDRK